MLATSLEFVAIVASQTLLGALSGATVAAPPFAGIVDVDDDVPAEWVGDGTPAPATLLTFAKARTDVGKLAFIVGLSRELLRMADARARRLIERIRCGRCRQAEDRELLSADAAVSRDAAGGAPGDGARDHVGSPGGLETDIELLLSHISDGAAARPFLIPSPRAALWMALQRTEDGARFPNARVDGKGDVAGIPLLVSRAAKNFLILVDASKLAVVDDGLDIDTSDVTAVQPVDNPSAGPTNHVSGFQNNTAFVKFQRYLSWTLAADDAVAYTEIAALAGSPS